MDYSHLAAAPVEAGQERKMSGALELFVDEEPGTFPEESAQVKERKRRARLSENSWTELV